MDVIFVVVYLVYMLVDFLFDILFLFVLLLSYHCVLFFLFFSKRNYFSE